MTDTLTSPLEGSGRSSTEKGRAWTFLSRHGQVLLCIAQQPDMRLRDIARRVGITDRAVQLVIHDLIAEGYLTSDRVGRRNRYTLHTDRPMRHPIVVHQEVRNFLKLVEPNPKS